MMEHAAETPQVNTTACSVNLRSRDAVKEKWAQKRQSKRPPPPNSPPIHQPRTTTPTISTLLPLCVILRRSWNEAVNSMKLFHGHTQEPNKMPNNHHKTSPHSSKRPPFPSVLSILQSHAIKRQIESMENQGELLSKYSAEYDFTTTLNAMAESRSRAFILLDFSTIVQTHTVVRKQLKGRVQLAYSTRYNANPKLLQLLASLGVAFKVATKHDLQLVKGTTQSGTTPTATIFDDFDVAGKPTPFYRSLLMDTTCTALAEFLPSIVVDGASELERIYLELDRVSSRRQQKMPRLECILKLDDIPQNEWEMTLCNLQQHAARLSCTCVGFAAENDINDTQFMGALSDLIQLSKKKNVVPSPQVHLCCGSMPSMATANNNRDNGSALHLVASLCQHCSMVSLDVSSTLVSNAAALCARIIGVKDKGALGTHYYIDDGCYGSLSNYSKHPVPLRQQGHFPSEVESVSAILLGEDGEQQTTTSVQATNKNLATVFGETCDGLDKICSNIHLPPLSRDDWLVFTDLGFCNEGTGFNGFSPPDVACCVLGDFA